MAAESQTADDAEITTRVDDAPISEPHDVVALVTNGTSGARWKITREDDTTVRVHTVRFHGTEMTVLDEVTMDVEVGEFTEDWAEDFANADPELAVERAREEFET